MAYRKHIHCLLIAIFLILLLQPAFGIIDENRNVNLIAEMENRTINPKPYSSLTSKDFYNEFQNWFEDRLLGRKQFIRLWAGVNGRLFHVLISKRVCMGKDGFLYSPFYLKDEMMDREQKLEQLTKIKQVCDKYQAHFVFNLIPHAEWMFGEQILKKHRPADVRKVENELELDLKKRGIDYCMYGQKMLQLPLKERQSMYYQGDLHWNSKGAFFGAKELLRHLRLNKNIPLAVVVSTLSSDVAIISTSFCLNIASILLASSTLRLNRSILVNTMASISCRLASISWSCGRSILLAL